MDGTIDIRDGGVLIVIDKAGRLVRAYARDQWAIAEIEEEEAR